MAEHNEIGKNGEDVAADYLLEHGFRILERNWRLGHKEIDIIAVDGDNLVFVEVKTRQTSPQKPVDVISNAKMKNLISAASFYLKTNNINLECRFDVLILTGCRGNYSINHIPGAFRPYLK